MQVVYICLCIYMYTYFQIFISVHPLKQDTVKCHFHVGRVEKLTSSSSFCVCRKCALLQLFLSHDFVPHRGSAVAAERQCSSWAECRAGTAVAPQPLGTALCHTCPASRNALRTGFVCVCPGLHVCFVCTCLQCHSDQLTALCFNENVASWANLSAYSQMERY